MRRCNSCHVKGGLQTSYFFGSWGRPKLVFIHPQVNALASVGLLSLAPAVFLDGGIPRELDDFLKFLEGLERFWCGGNPWVEPPVAVVGEFGSRPGVRSYFVDLYREKRVIARSLKVVLVGREGTGKTRCSQNIADSRDVSDGHDLAHEYVAYLLPCQPDLVPTCP